MNFPGMGGGGGVPGIPSGGSATGSIPPGFDPNDPNVKWVCPSLPPPTGRSPYEEDS
jgi:hypothetical protein